MNSNIIKGLFIKRFPWILIIMVLLFILIASIVIGLATEEQSLNKSSPEGTVQQFLRAIELEDLELAYGFLSAELSNRCSIEDLIETFGPDHHLMDTRITLDRILTVGDITYVVVETSRFSSDSPFNTSDTNEQQRFSLISERGIWKFYSYPWPLNACKQSNNTQNLSTYSIWMSAPLVLPGVYLERIL